MGWRAAETVLVVGMDDPVSADCCANDCDEFRLGSILGNESPLVVSDDEGIMSFSAGTVPLIIVSSNGINGASSPSD